MTNFEALKSIETVGDCEQVLREKQAEVDATQRQIDALRAQFDEAKRVLVNRMSKGAMPR